MPKKKVKERIPKIKASKKKPARQTAKFRFGLILLGIIALGYWWFTSGQKVEIPKIPGSTVQQMSPTPEITWETYTVKPGDTIKGIALQVYGDANAWEKIARVNNLKNPNSIHAGNVLRIPR